MESFRRIESLQKEKEKGRGDEEFVAKQNRGVKNYCNYWQRY